VRAAGIVQPRELAILQSPPGSIGSSGISEMRHLVDLRLATKCPSQRHRSRETAIERSTERHGNGNDGHCEPEAEFRVDFEKQSMIDAVMSS
jgi:hypothetical protein